MREDSAENRVRKILMRIDCTQFAREITSCFSDDAVEKTVRACDANARERTLREHHCTAKVFMS